MATKSVNQEFDPQIVNHYNLDGAPIYGVLSKSADNISKYIYIEYDEVSLRNIKRFYNETITQVPKNKKVFLLPYSPLSLVRFKSICKDLDLKVTNDYESADIIVTHDQLEKDFSYGEQIQSSILIPKISNYSTITDTYGVRKIIDESDVPTIYDTSCRTTLRWKASSNGPYLNYGYLISSLFLNVAHTIESKNLDVIHLETIKKSSSNKTQITEDLIQSIKSLLNSNTKDDLQMAGKIIPTIDYESDIYSLWVLSKEVGIMFYRADKDKDVRDWMNKSNIMNMSRYSAEELVLKLNEVGQLTPKLFKKFEKMARREIQISNRALYNFQVNIKPEFAKFLIDE